MWPKETFLATLCSLQMSSRKSCVAIVGGGITGACAASELATHFDNIIVFDQGRRGPGGRASHRSVRESDGTVMADDDVLDHSASDILQFDHGCQFFRGDTKEMSERLLPEWISLGWVAPWKARLGCVNTTLNTGVKDFFGVPTNDAEVYIGVGGMHLLPRKILDAAKVTVRRGTRVASVRKSGEKWELRGTRGDAAFHDTMEADAQRVQEESLCLADAVIFTDISSSSESWHRASAGIPNTLRKKIPNKARLPLFSCMVALDRPVGHLIPYDGFTVAGNSDLWFAARSQSKPGIPQGGSECWTLVSTPSFAVSQIKKTTMRDPITGEFRPQENDYLNTIPGPALFDAFLRAIMPQLPDNETPKSTYLQAQRWGSGLPVPDSLVDKEEEIVGTRYCSELKSSLAFLTTQNQGDCDEFLADDDHNLYYAGDFCSYRNPGFEAAALSGVSVARYIITESGLS